LKERDDSLVRAATTASLDAQQDSSNITKTQSKATLNEPTPQGEGSGSGPGHQETMGGAMAQIRSEGALIQSIDPPLSTDEDADTKMIIEDKGNGEKGGSTKETVSTARPDISAARPKDSIAEPETPPTTTNLFNDGDVAIANTLVKMKNQKAKEKGIAFKDTDDSARPIRSITTLQPLLTIDPKYKGKGILQESEPDRKRKTKEASKAALAKMYDDVQAPIDDDHELAIRLTLEEQEKYTVEERFTHAQLKSRSFEEIHKLYIKEQKWVDAFVPIGSEEDEKRIGSRKKRAAGSSTKHKSTKKQKMNDQDFEDINKEHRKCLKVVPDNDKAIEYETSDVKSSIVDLSINMFVEKRYPLTKEILDKMLSLRLEAKTKSTLALDLIKFIKLQIEEK
nr:hypothetical protein [Tanacetum cinerariifolium]